MRFCKPPTGFLLEIEIRKRLVVLVAADEARIVVLPDVLFAGANTAET
jgi:hypothetical protein